VADVLVDREGHALLVVDKVDLGELDEGGRAVAQLKLQLAAAADDLLGRDAVGRLGKGPYELDAPAGDDVGLQAVGAQVVEHLDHGLVDDAGVGLAGCWVPGCGQRLLDDLVKLVGG
jgi:hypothetical protein